MQKWELIDLIKECEIPSNSYSFNGGMTEGCSAIEFTEDETWHVYKVQDQHKHQLKIFISENDAYEYFWQLLAGKHDADSFYIKSKFFNGLIYLAVAFALTLLLAGTRLLLIGYEKWEYEFSAQIAAICYALVFGIALWILSREKLVLYIDRIDIYTFLGRLKETVLFADIVNIGFAQAKVRTDISGSGYATFDMFFATASKRYGYTSTSYLNAKEMYAHLVSKVNIQKDDVQISTEKDQLLKQAVLYDQILNLVVFIVGLILLAYGSNKYSASTPVDFWLPISIGLPFSIWGFIGLVGYTMEYFKKDKQQE
jgi:hypothetical protein